MSGSLVPLEERLAVSAKAKARGTGGDRDEWKKIQERTFTNWFNDRLRGHLKVARQQVHKCTNKYDPKMLGL